MRAAVAHVTAGCVCVCVYVPHTVQQPEGERERMKHLTGAVRDTELGSIAAELLCSPLLCGFVSSPSFHSFTPAIFTLHSFTLHSFTPVSSTVLPRPGGAGWP